MWLRKEKSLHDIVYPYRKRVWDKFKQFLNQYFVELFLVVLFFVGWLSGRGVG